MNWKFWKKDDEKDETTIKVTTTTGGTGKEIYVCAQTSDKAIELYDKLKEREKHE